MDSVLDPQPLSGSFTGAYLDLLFGILIKLSITGKYGSCVTRGLLQRGLYHPIMSLPSSQVSSLSFSSSVR